MRIESPYTQPGRDMKISYLALGCVAVFALSGCVSTSTALEIGKDTYSVTSTADGFRTAASARQNAFEEGARKCEETGRKFKLVRETSRPTRMGIDTTIEITFRCLLATDPEYLR